MRADQRWKFIGCIGTLFLSALHCDAASTRNGGSLLSERIARFEFHGKSRARGHVGSLIPGGIAQAALALGGHSEVRICIEELSPVPGESPVEIEISAKNTTVGEILKRMIVQDPRYFYRERLGVIEVLPVRAVNDPSDCLNMIIPAFRVHYLSSIAWSLVRCEIDIISRDPNDVVPDPLQSGRCSGRPHRSHFPERVIQATFENKSVRDIADQLSSMIGNLAWYAAFKQAQPSCGSLQLGQYAPKGEYPADPDAKVWTRWVEGLPKKCVNCHYHQRASEGKPGK